MSKEKNVVKEELSTEEQEIVNSEAAEKATEDSVQESADLADEERGEVGDDQEGSGMSTDPEYIPEGITQEDIDLSREYEKKFGPKNPLKVIMELEARIDLLEKKVF